MGYINRRYSDSYKKKYKHTGFLYESRYFADMVTNPQDLLKVSRYIHRNPIDTTVPMVNRMEDYLYSSFYLYKNNSRSPYPFLNLDLLPSLLQEAHELVPEVYCRYCEKEIDASKPSASSRV